ncbi:MAG: transporter substrate-binding domain-containing protein [Ruminococcaceae bacterium]|nr:transporter substrate-binding domain-containing protein [Oscillospiraceae bacterium]
MKKILSLVLVAAMLVMCFALTACNEKEDVIGGADDKTDIVVDDNKDKATLKMATNAYFQPYEYYQDGVIVGIDAEIAAAIAEYLDMELVIEDMQFDTIITAVKGGSVDFGMAGMTVNEERLLEVNFTNSYASGVQVVIVKEDSAITTVDDLFADDATYKAGVQLGTTGDTYATGDLGADRVTQYDNANNAVLGLIGGDVDCVIIDNEPAKALVQANEGLKILDTTYADEDYAICVKKENTELLEKLNEAIVELTKNGKISEIVAKYIK